jgi:hypothetical protein
VHRRSFLLLVASCSAIHLDTVHWSLANVCGWDAKLEEVTRRLRCSKCGERRCTAKALPPVAPRGYKSH